MEEPSQKKSRNIDFTEFENDTIQKCESPMDAIPRWNYDVLRIIFQYLKAKDLHNAAKVCRSWLEAAHKEKQTRKHFEYIFCTRHCTELKIIDSIWIEPSIGFHFITHSSCINASCNYLAELSFPLPRSYNSIIFEVNAVILENDIRNKDGTKTVSRYFKYIKFIGKSYILSAYLPHIPNVHINTFVRDELKCRKDVDSTNKALENFIDNLMIDITSKQNHENSLCFMLFSNHQFSRTLLATIRERCKNKRVSVWGGRVKNTFNEHAYRALCDFHIAVVAISGLMRSWSVVVDTTWKAKQVENRLTIFKDQVKLKKYSIGFVFADNCRRKYLSNSYKNEESTIFKRVFPQVPLIGCSGRFVFGIDTDPISDEQEEYKRFWPSSEPWCHVSATVFMILTHD